MLSVKGLFNHIKNMSPTCTINIPFELRKIDEPLNFVTFLRISHEGKTIGNATLLAYLVELLKGYDGANQQNPSCLSDLFSFALKKHPNIRKLYVRFIKNIHSPNWTIWPFENVSMNENSITHDHSFLKELHLEVSSIHLRITETFPKVEILSLLKVGNVCELFDNESEMYRYGGEEYRSECHKDFYHNSQSSFLMMLDGSENEHGRSFERPTKLDVPNWKKSFPSLTNLRLSCWKLVNEKSFSTLKNQLKTLHLDNTKLLTPLDEFSNLRTLRLTDDDSCVGIKQLGYNFPELENLILDNDGLISEYIGYDTFPSRLEDSLHYNYWEDDSDDMEVSLINFNQNKTNIRLKFPCLKKIYIDATGKKWKGTLQIVDESQFLSLEEVTFVDFYASIQISNTPSLKRIRCLESKKWLFETFSRFRNHNSPPTISLSRIGRTLEEIEAVTHILRSDTWTELEEENFQNNSHLKKIDVRFSSKYCSEHEEREIDVSIVGCDNLEFINNFHLREQFVIKKIADCPSLESIELNAVHDSFVLDKLPSLKNVGICDNKNIDIFLSQINSILSIEELRIQNYNPIDDSQKNILDHANVRKVEIFGYKQDTLRIKPIMDCYLEELVIILSREQSFGTTLEKPQNIEISGLQRLKKCTIKRGFLYWRKNYVIISKLPQLLYLKLDGIDEGNLFDLPCLEHIELKDTYTFKIRNLHSLKSVRLEQSDRVLSLQTWCISDCRRLESISLEYSERFSPFLSKYDTKWKVKFNSSSITLQNLPALCSIKIPYWSTKTVSVMNCENITELQLQLLFFSRDTPFNEKGYGITGDLFPNLKKIVVNAYGFSKNDRSKLLKIKGLFGLRLLEEVVFMGEFDQKLVFESIGDDNNNKNCVVLEKKNDDVLETMYDSLDVYKKEFYDDSEKKGNDGDFELPESFSDDDDDDY